MASRYLPRSFLMKSGSSSREPFRIFRKASVSLSRWAGCSARKERRSGHTGILQEKNRLRQRRKALYSAGSRPSGRFLPGRFLRPEASRSFPYIRRPGFQTDPKQDIIDLKTGKKLFQISGVRGAEHSRDDVDLTVLFRLHLSKFHNGQKRREEAFILVPE